jgi:hypothetical protein
MVEFVNAGMVFKEELYPVHLMVTHTEIDGIQFIQYHTSSWGDAFHIPEVVF